MKPWDKLDEKLVYDGYRKVVRRTFAMPDGRETDYDIIASNGGAAILALTEKQEVLCFQQFRPGPEMVLYELPGGGVEPGEDPMEAAGRELLEETGHSAELELIGSYPRDAYMSGLWHIFIGRNARLTGVQTFSDNEHGQLIKLPVAEFKEKLYAGLMTDAALGYAGLHRLGLL